MYITSTNAPKVAGSAQTVTISIPKVDTEKVVDKAWNFVDTFETGFSKTGPALLSGVASAIPIVGYNLSKHIRQGFGESAKADQRNKINDATNTVTALAQIGGMAVGVASAAAGLAGFSVAGPMFKASVGLFGLAGMSGLATGYATPDISVLAGDF